MRFVLGKHCLELFCEGGTLGTLIQDVLDGMTEFMGHDRSERVTARWVKSEGGV